MPQSGDATVGKDDAIPGDISQEDTTKCARELAYWQIELNTDRQ
jgi:hypothetical protein